LGYADLKFTGVAMIQAPTRSVISSENQPDHSSENQPDQDQHLIYSGLTWAHFKLIQSGFADSTGVRQINDIFDDLCSQST